jgi:ribosomal protein S18 acetylase RimI-like enzyme
MNFDEYKSVMWVQYSLLEGLAFNSKIKQDTYDIYKSDIVTDYFCNFTILNNEYAFDNASTLLDIEQRFKDINRQACIYIPRMINKYNDYSSYLISNGYKVNDIASYMVLVGSDKNIKIIDNIEKVQSKKQYDDFMEVLESAYGGEVTKENPYAGSITDEYREAIQKSLENSKFSHFILYRRGIPVSVTTLSYNNSNGVLSNVGTKKEYQNLGFGKQIMRYCIHKFSELGGKKLFLFTEFDSKNEKWYTKLGFKTIFIDEQYLKI